MPATTDTRADLLGIVNDLAGILDRHPIYYRTPPQDLRAIAVELAAVWNGPIAAACDRAGAAWDPATRRYRLSNEAAEVRP